VSFGQQKVKFLRLKLATPITSATDELPWSMRNFKLFGQNIDKSM
jgi:hypothetical protein